MSSTRPAGRWTGLLEDARVWPRRIARASLLVSLAILAGLVAYYLETGNKAIILAIVIIAASIPIDLVILKAVLEGSLYTNALEIARILEEAGVGAYKSRPVFNGILVAAHAGDGQVHVILKPSTVEAAYIESPGVTPLRGRARPVIKAPIKPPRNTRKCTSELAKGVIKIVSLDPSTGIPVRVEGTGIYAYKACPNALDPKDVREILGLVLPR